MYIPTAEYLVFLIIATFTGYSSFFIIQYIFNLLAYNVKQLTYKLKISLKRHQNLLNRTLDYQEIINKKNSNSSTTHFLLTYVTFIRNYFNIIKAL